MSNLDATSLELAVKSLRVALVHAQTAHDADPLGQFVENAVKFAFDQAHTAHCLALEAEEANDNG